MKSFKEYLYEQNIDESFLPSNDALRKIRNTTVATGLSALSLMGASGLQTNFKYRAAQINQAKAEHRARPATGTPTELPSINFLDMPARSVTHGEGWPIQEHTGHYGHGPLKKRPFDPSLKGTTIHAAETPKGVAVPYDLIKKHLGLSAVEWDTYRAAIAAKESHGMGNYDYGVVGGSNGTYDGKFQLGSMAVHDGAEFWRDNGGDKTFDAKTHLLQSMGKGGKRPKHTSDNWTHPSRMAFLKDPQLQENLFASYTIRNHIYLLTTNSISILHPRGADGKHRRYKDLTPLEQAEVLAMAHNGGHAAASKIASGKIKDGTDGFGTQHSSYRTSFINAHKAITDHIKKNTPTTPSATPAATPAEVVDPRGLARKALAYGMMAGAGTIGLGTMGGLAGWGLGGALRRRRAEAIRRRRTG